MGHRGKGIDLEKDWMVIVPFWSLNWVQGSSSFVREIWENPNTVFFTSEGGYPPFKNDHLSKDPKNGSFYPQNSIC